MKTMPSIRGEMARSEPAIVRLGRLPTLGLASIGALQAASELDFISAAGVDLIVEGKETGRPLLVLEGWAARVRLLEDGRRQILSLILPGDIIGNCRQSHPLAVSTISAITDLRLCPAPCADDLPDLAEAYAVSAAIDEAYLLANITRLGRLTAHERICDLLLEWHERLSLAGLVHDNEFIVPMTQETLADATGLTAVHVNRTLQLLRRECELTWKSRHVFIPNPARLATQIGRNPVRVTAVPAPLLSLAI